MSAPAPNIEFHSVVRCATCGKDIYTSVAHNEEQAKEAFAKGLTASELHDCKGGPKGAKASHAP